RGLAHHAHPRAESHRTRSRPGLRRRGVAASVLYTTAFVFHAPISTTHTITSAIMGVGATKRLSAVRWGVARNIAVAWVLTIPAAAVVAAGMYFLLHLFI